MKARVLFGAIRGAQGEAQDDTRHGAHTGARTGARNGLLRRALQGALLGALMAGTLLTAVQAEEPKLSQEQLGRLLKVVETKGTSTPIPPLVAAVLKLNGTQHVPTVKQVTFEAADGVKHGFAPLNDKSGFIFFRRQPPSGQSVFRVGPDLHLIVAGTSVDTSRINTLSSEEGNQGLDEELSRWADVLSPRNAPAAAATPQSKAPEAARK